MGAVAAANAHIRPPPGQIIRAGPCAARLHGNRSPGDGQCRKESTARPGSSVYGMGARTTPRCCTRVRRTPLHGALPLLRSSQSPPRSLPPFSSVAGPHLFTEDSL